MTFKDKKWYNLGDVSPREYGGIFVRKDGDEIETVSTDNMEDVGLKGYQVNRRSDYVSELKDQWEKFKQDPDNCRSCSSSMDWKRYLEMEKNGMTFDSLVFYLAVDMILYFGGSCEIESGTNYWELLATDGIRHDNYI